MTLALQLTSLTTTFFLVSARVAGIMVSAPLFSSSYIPATLRVAMVFLLGLILTPGLHAAPGMAGSFLILGVLVQFGVGTLMGLVLAVFLSIFAVAGQVVTYQLGVGLAVAANPGLLTAGSFLAEWFTLLATLVFVAGGGPELTVMGLQASFRAITLNALVIPGASFGFVAGLMQMTLEVALLIAAPLIITGLIVNLSVGILSRAFPQINAYFFALPISFGLSLLILLAMLPFLMTAMSTVWQQGWTEVSHLLLYLEGRAP